MVLIQLTTIRRGSLLFVLVFGAAMTGCTSSPTAVESPAARSKAAASVTPAVAPSSSASSSSLIGHSSGKNTPASNSEASRETAPASGDGAAAGGIKWAVPTGWKTGPERSMRAATYLIPAAAGDAEGGECGVFFFGAGQGGGVQANIDRWIGQFKQSDGSASNNAAKQKSETINGFKVTRVDVSGIYTGGMSGGSGDKAGWRLLGAIVEAPESAVFFKLTGPVKTVVAAEADFQSLLKSIRQQ